MSQGNSAAADECRRVLVPQRCCGDLSWTTTSVLAVDPWQDTIVIDQHSDDIDSVDTAAVAPTFGLLMAGLATMMLAAFSPFVLMRLISTDPGASTAEARAAVGGSLGTVARWRRQGRGDGQEGRGPMTTANDEVSYRLDPLDRGFLGPLSRRQVFVSAAGGLLWLLFGLVAKMMIVGFVVLGVAVVVAIPPFAGQPIVEWLPIWSGWLLRGRWARRWVRPLHLTTGGPLRSQPSLPAWLGGLRIVAHPVEHWAAIHDTAAKTLTAHLQIAGSGFSTLSTDQMHFLLAGWGQVFGAIPPEDGLVRITWSDIARRVPHVGHDEWLATRPPRRSTLACLPRLRRRSRRCTPRLGVDGDVEGRGVPRPSEPDHVDGAPQGGGNDGGRRVG